MTNKTLTMCSASKYRCEAKHSCLRYDKKSNNSFVTYFDSNGEFAGCSKFELKELEVITKKRSLWGK